MDQPMNKSGESSAPGVREAYRVERVFLGSRTAEQVVADLIRVHTNERPQG